MTDKITKLVRRPKVTWLVYVPNERNPSYIEATNYAIVPGTDVLQLLDNNRIVAMFNRWDYVERLESEEDVA